MRKYEYTFAYLRIGASYLGYLGYLSVDPPDIRVMYFGWMLVPSSARARSPLLLSTSLIKAGA